ncbi:hypothetical protein GGR77_003062 [Xanthomonas translucens]
MKPRVETLTVHRIFDPEKKCIGNVSPAPAQHVRVCEKCAGDACFSAKNAGTCGAIALLVLRPFSFSCHGRLAIAGALEHASHVSTLHDNRNMHDAILKSRCRIFAGPPLPNSPRCLPITC